MKRLSFSVMLAALTAVMTTPVMAADVEIAPAFSWTALHIGVGGGAGFNSYDAYSAFDIDAWDWAVPFFMDIESDQGKFYGFLTGEIGADYQFGDSPIVAGILASYDFNGSSKAGSDFSSESSEDYQEGHLETSLDDTWFIGGRLGVVSHERTLWYGLAGYTGAEGTVETLLGFEGEFGDDYGYVKKSKQVGGLTLGAGVEHAFTDAISLKVEYRHDFLGSVKWDEASYDPEWDGVDDDNTSYGKASFDRDTIRAVLSFRLGMWD
jgi:outer membrane immunogenic protein